jgi:hypothetical protein
MSGNDRDALAAANEATHRKVNEAIARGRWPDESDPIVFRCECARNGCTAMVRMSKTQYEQLRTHPRRFVVIPGHQDPAVEDVVESQDEYLLVEKHGLAGELVVCQATFAVLMRCCSRRSLGLRLRQAM